MIRATPTRTDAAKMNGLRRPIRSDSGPATTIETRMPARLATPNSGIAASAPLEPRWMKSVRMYAAGL
ncbi:hypothetical protein ABH923_001617 [Leifsonia sp. EB41]